MSNNSPNAVPVRGPLLNSKAQPLYGNSSGKPASVSPSLAPVQQQQMQPQQLIVPQPQQQPMQQQQLPKREIIFPPDCVEATPAVIYRRKRVCRADLGPVDAWRIIMSLRSGLLAEGCYALDALNVLLFDDTSIPYFGLTQWPGLLDLLQEYFRKALTDMFETKTFAPDSAGLDVDVAATTTNKPVDSITRPRSMTPEEDPDHVVDLGGVYDPIDPETKTTYFHRTTNYTMASRLKPALEVKMVDRPDDIFVRDHHKDWDTKGDAAGINILAAISTDPWQLQHADHILPTFQAEFGKLPFCRRINKTVMKVVQEEVQQEEVMVVRGEEQTEEEQTVVEVKEDVAAKEEVDEAASKTVKEAEVTATVVTAVGAGKRRRTKTLSDVISRIKKDSNNSDSVTMDLLATDASHSVTCNVNGGGVNSGTEDSKDSKDSTGVIAPALLMDKTEPATDECDSSSSNSSAASQNSRPFSEATPTPNTSIQNATITTTITSGGVNLNVRDAAGTLKRRRMSDYEDESYARDEASLVLVTESQDCVGKRTVCISNILRSLTFVPGNEIEFARNATFLGLVGKLLLLHHEHPARTHKTRNYDREEDADFADSCSSLQGETEWWWDFLLAIRENILVSVANIAGQIDLDQYSEQTARPLLDGLLHWAVCPSAQGQDPFASVGASSLLSPQRLALEALCKLCVTNSNVDLVIATPPFSRLERLCTVLTKHLCRSEDQVLREFAINLLHYLAAADSSMARVVAIQPPCVSLLVAFIEQAEQSAMGVANQHGIGALRDNPDSMGTSLDMLRRAASTLVFLAEHPDNRPLLVQQESRLLALVMSQILDQQVALLLAKVLFKISHS